MPDPSEITRLLRARADGQAGAELHRLLYAELRRLAGELMRGQPRDHTLQATALVHEAWMKLIGAEEREAWEDRRHFLCVAATAMRSVLIDHARAKQALKRGGGERERVPLDDVLERAEESVQDVLVFDEALERLQATEPDLARLVELRFYAGLTMEEVAQSLEVSKPTAERRWRVARALLWDELSDQDGPSEDA